MSNRTITKALIATTVLLCLFATQASGSMSHRKHFRAGKDRPTKVVFNEMEIEVPAGAEEEELSVEWGDPDLSGLKKPYGFDLFFILIPNTPDNPLLFQNNSHKYPVNNVSA